MRLHALLPCRLLPLAVARAGLPDDATIAAELRADVEDAKQARATQPRPGGCLWA
jgi:hypothetical protein